MIRCLFVISLIMILGDPVLADDDPVTWHETRNNNGTITLTGRIEGVEVTIANSQRYPAEWGITVNNHWIGPLGLENAKQKARSIVYTVLNDVPVLIYQGHRIDVIRDNSGYYYNYMIDFVCNDRELYFERRIVAVGEARRRIDQGDLPKQK